MRAMRYDKYGLNRRSIRMQGHDYSLGGSYYITICTYDRECLYGDVADGEMILSEYGQIVREEWERSTTIRPGLALDSYVVMPNHLHGLVTLVDGRDVGATCGPLDNKGGRPDKNGGHPEHDGERASPTQRATAGRPYGPAPEVGWGEGG
jgi:REP element-mobilizing transposase RayT